MSGLIVLLFLFLSQLFKNKFKYTSSPNILSTPIETTPGGGGDVNRYDDTLLVNFFMYVQKGLLQPNNLFSVSHNGIVYSMICCMKCLWLCYADAWQPGWLHQVLLRTSTALADNVAKRAA